MDHQKCPRATLAWLVRYCRLTIDYEVLPTSSEAFIYAALEGFRYRYGIGVIYPLHSLLNDRVLVLTGILVLSLFHRSQNIG